MSIVGDAELAVGAATGARSGHDADRVRGIDDLDASVITPASAGGGAGAVHADTGAAPAGR